MVEFGKPFGLDKGVINSLNWDLAAQKIMNDIKSDFIYAPHINVIYRWNSRGLAEIVKGELQGGTFLPGQPLTLEVPKSARMRIATRPARSGPNYTRPGSILFPKDRIFYQILADGAIDVISARTDKSRSFSHHIDEDNPEKMFRSTRACWADFQKALKEYAEDDSVNYVIKLDIANFFSSINQHTLVNMLSDAGYPKTFVDRLENVLLTFTTNRSSRGIVQGMFPSDMLGNYYLSPFDRFLNDEGVQSARYVDDVYIFVDSTASADALIRAVAPELRSYDLALNEAKCCIFPKAQLVVEEPDLEQLFQDAIDEVRAQLEDNDFETDYGFQSGWDDDENDGEDREDEGGDASENIVNLELEATKGLFDSLDDFPGHEENIERFCLPLFAKVESDHAVDHVIRHFDDRPSMAQIYCAYLARFINRDDVKAALAVKVSDDRLQDWQRMWVLAALARASAVSDVAEQAAYQSFRDATRHDALRAAAAIYLGRFGDAARRRSLAGEYTRVSEYVQSAIYFISQLAWSGPDKTNAHANWGRRGELNQLITDAFAANRASKKK